MAIPQTGIFTLPQAENEPMVRFSGMSFSYLYRKRMLLVAKNE